ncbi:MAG: SPOR domain-containing protein [Bacteroidota bacterium]
MEFGKHIHELLLTNETVIIPGFGAFVSEYKPAELIEDSEEIKPPSKVIKFNRQIRNNDGLLVGHIAESEGISHFDALKVIEKEREDIIYQLDKGEKVTLKETGVLFYNEQNEIEFDPEHDENLLLDSFGLETTTITTTPEEIPEEKTTEPIITEEATSEPPVEVPVKEEPEPVAATVPPIEKEKKKRKGGWLWLLLIFIPLAVITVFIITKDTVKEMPPASTSEVIEETTIDEPVVTQDSVTQDSTVVTKIDTATKEAIEPEPEVTEKPDTPKYYLVGGSFKEEVNAETYLQKLKAKGFEPFHLGKRGNFYIVGIGTYDTEDEAFAAKREYMEKSPGSGVWIWKK